MIFIAFSARFMALVLQIALPSVCEIRLSYNGMTLIRFTELHAYCFRSSSRSPFGQGCGPKDVELEFRRTRNQSKCRTIRMRTA